MGAGWGLEREDGDVVAVFVERVVERSTTENGGLWMGAGEFVGRVYKRVAGS